MRKKCFKCEDMKGIEDSLGRTIYLCTNAESGAYMEETGVCGSCELEDQEDV